jgi:flagellar basal-body rod protein FlgC
MEIISQNLANAETTGPQGPYRRKLPVFSEQVGGLGLSASASGVKVTAILEDTSPPKLIYDPGNPLAGADGYIRKPNINIVSEMVDLMAAVRAYEANVAVVGDTKRLVDAALQIGA